MAIISKPEIIFKGTPATITLFKINLLSNHIVSANSRFSDSQNWKKVQLNYKSSEGNQRILVEFDESTNFLYGTFSASERARTFFNIDSLIIVDKDGEILKLNRSDLNTLEFDVQLENTGSESEEFVLLLEDGSNFLLESGGYLVL
jgi:hypothetical protein